jgi:tRNA-2-methylthio-N6-dimethylallyladenosine synthase
MPDKVPADVVADRYGRLVALVEEIAWAENRAFDGQVVEVLVAEGEGRKDDATQRLSGRARDNRLVHLAGRLAGTGEPLDARPGDLVDARVTHAAPHHLVADEVLGVRRTRGGDAWQARTQAPPEQRGVLLGLPTVRAR